MKTHFRKPLSFLLAAVMTMTVMTALTFSPAVTVSAATPADTAFSDTRYRFPFCNFEDSVYQTGVAIDDDSVMSDNYIHTGTPEKNGTAATDLYYAHIENYDLFHMTSGANHAFKLTCSDQTDHTVADEYVSLNIFSNEKCSTGITGQFIPDNIDGFDKYTDDHGLMFHLEVKGLPGKEADGFVEAKTDNSSPAEIIGYEKHKSVSLNCVFGEVDYKEDGTPYMKQGRVQRSDRNAAPGAKITLIWTKDVSWTNPDAGKDPSESEYTQLACAEDGKAYKNPDGSYRYELIPSYTHHAGDVQVITVPRYDYSGETLGGGTAIPFPRDFCGYVKIPFSQFQLIWESGDIDGKVNMKNVQFVNFYTPVFWMDQGEIVLDEIAFYGEAFSYSNNAYDYGTVTMANHRDALLNRELIRHYATLSYNANGGSGAPAKKTILTATFFPLSSVQPTRAGYRFLGWASDKNATTADLISEEEIEIFKDCTLYAVWQAATPEKPHLQAVSATTNGIQIWWRDNQATEGYYIYRKVNNGSWSRYAEISGLHLSSYTDTKVTSGNTYSYRVVGYIGNQKSSYENGLSVTYLASPKISAASNTTGGVQVKWNRVSSATGYALYRKTTGGWSRIANIKGGSTVSYLDKTAKSGTTYTYTVRAVKGSAMSSYYSGTTTTRLVNPTVSTVSNTTGGVQVKWNQVPAATGYALYRKTTGGWSRIANIKGGSTVSYLDKTAKSGTTYTYTVRAVKGSVMSSYYGGKKGKCLAAPKLKSATAVSNGINIKWQKPAGATGYVIYRKTTGGWSRIANIKSGNTVSYTDKTAKKGTTYTYTVRATNGGTMSSYYGGLRKKR